MNLLDSDNPDAKGKHAVQLEHDHTCFTELIGQKRLVDLFHIGPHYYYVFNCETRKIEMLDDMATQVLGFPIEHLTPKFLIGLMHPEDAPYFLRFETAIIEFYRQLPVDKILKYKASFDIRLRTSSNKYVRILQQLTPIQIGADDLVYRVLGVHTDVSLLKSDGKPILNIFGMDGEPSFFNVSVPRPVPFIKPRLTKRELEVLRLISQGMVTDAIAAQLCISPETVKKHRKNILSKSGSKNTAELIALAVEEGWL